MIFSSNILLVVTFSHVLHLDVLRRQIELKLKVKTEISLCMAIMETTYCHPYIHSTTILCGIRSTWCIMICLVIPILSLLQSLYSLKFSIYLCTCKIHLQLHKYTCTCTHARVLHEQMHVLVRVHIPSNTSTCTST